MDGKLALKSGAKRTRSDFPENITKIRHAVDRGGNIRSPLERTLH